MLGIVFALPKYTIKTNNLFHLQSQSILMSSFVRIKLKQPFLEPLTPALTCLSIFLSLVIESTAAFFIIDESSISMVSFLEIFKATMSSP